MTGTLKALGIVQARMGSSRLPGKVLYEIAGHTMLWHVVSRARQCALLDEVMVATTSCLADDPIAGFCERENILCFRGSEADVLDRYYRAASSREASVIVRITADCPTLDPDVVTKVVRAFLDGEWDYVSNTNPPTYPDGLDTEVFSLAALETAWHKATWQSEREHVTPYIRNHPEEFRSTNVVNETDLSDLRWTVDEEKDLTFVRALFSHLDARRFRMRDVLAVLAAKPQLSAINTGIRRNEGYEASLAKDRRVDTRQI